MAEAVDGRGSAESRVELILARGDESGDLSVAAFISCVGAQPVRDHSHLTRREHRAQGALLQPDAVTIGVVVCLVNELGAQRIGEDVAGRCTDVFIAP